MKKLFRNKKGFTLIELLAVIVIMGILIMVAIPAVTRYILQSRKDAFADTAKSYITAVRYAYLNDELNCNGSYPTAGTLYYKLDAADLEKGGTSPWSNSKITGYVRIEIKENASTAKYYFTGVDGKGHGISEEKEESTISRDVVKTSGATSAATIGTPVCTIDPAGASK